MKMFDGTPFVEIKNGGKFASKRVYGLVKGVHLQFVMLAEHSDSAGDVIHKRLKDMIE